MIEAGGMSSRHGRASDSVAARKAAIEKLIERGVLMRDRNKLFWVTNVDGKVQRTEVTVHPIKGLLRLPERRSRDPLSLLRIPIRT